MHFTKKQVFLITSVGVRYWIISLIAYKIITRFNTSRHPNNTPNLIFLKI